MLSIENQCKKLYMTAFGDDEEFTSLLFQKAFEKCCHYIEDNGTVVSMLFAFDVYINGVKGKYIYGVATDERFRHKGFMRRLFSQTEERLKDEYLFLCLRPMEEGLFEFYRKLGFEDKMYKSDMYAETSENTRKGICITDAVTVNEVRKHFAKKNFALYSDTFTELLLAYCDAYTDSVNEPTYFVLKERVSGKVKEVLGDIQSIPKEMCCGKMQSMGEDYRYAMFKDMGYTFDGKGYLGLAMD